MEKTKSQLISENEELGKRISELEGSQKNSELLERALLEGEHRYRSLYENAPLGYMSLDERGNLIEVNEAWCNTLGYEREEVIGMNIVGYLSFESQQIFKDNFPELKEKGKIFDEEYEMIKEDGSQVIMSFESKAVYSVDGEFKQTHSVLYNITERRGMESQKDAALKELKESEEKYRSLVYYINDAIYETDETFIIRFISPAIDYIFGYKSEDITGKSLEDYIYADDLKLYKKRFKIASSGIGGRTECRIKAKSGEIRWVNLSYKPILSDEKFVGMRGVISDITERKKVQEELIERENELRLITESSLDTIFVLTKTGNVKYVSQSAEKIFGYKPDEIIGNSFAGYVPKKELPKYWKALKNVIRNKVLTNFETYIKKRNGDLVPVEINGQIVKKGKEILAQGTIRDITERKHTEEALLKSERRLKNAQELSKVGDYEWELETNKITWSDGLYRIFGFPVGTHLRYKEILKCIHPDDREYNTEMMNKWSKDRGGEPYEYRIFHEDGTMRYLYEECDVIHDKKGKPEKLFGVVHDITERKWVEESLLGSEKRYELAVLAGNVGVWDIDLSTNKIHLDPHLKRMLGYEDHEIENNLDVWSKYVYAEDSDLVTEKFQDHISKKTPEYIVEYRMVHKDGSIRWFLARGKAVFDDFGNPYRVIGTDTDITEYKLVESRRDAVLKALRESEEKLRAQYKSIPIPTYTWQRVGEDFILMNYNDAAVEITKGKIADYLGSKASEMYRDKPEIVDEISQCFTKKTSIDREMLYTFKSTGESKYLAIKYAYVPQDFVLVHTEDITERKRAEEELRKSEEKYRTLSEAINDIIFTLDREGKFTYLSPAFEKVTGYNVKDFIGRSFTEVLVPEYIESTVDKFKRGLSGEVIPLYEIELLHKDKGRVPVELNVTSLFDVEGKTIGRLGIVRDITERLSAKKASELAAEELKCRVDFQDIVATLSTKFINVSPDKIDKEINNALKVIGEFCSVNRSYVFLFSEDGLIMDNIHEWCAEGISQEINNLKGLNTGIFPWAINRLKNLEHVYVPNVNNLPHEAKAEKESFQQQKIQSLVLVPLVFEGKAIGFIGFDSVQKKMTWSGDSITLLKLVGEMFVNSLQRIKVEKALIQAEENFRSIFENAVEGIYQTTPDGKFINVNPALARMLGYITPESLIKEVINIGKQLYVNPEQRKKFEKLIEKRSVVRDFEVQLYHKSGKKIWASITSRVVRDRKGKIQYYEGTFEDITMHKQSEEEIRKLSRVVGQSPVSVVITDTDGNIEYINPKFTEITGYKYEEVVGKNPRILKSGETLPDEYKRLWNTITKGGEWTGEFHNRKKNGKLYWEFATITPILNEEGKISHYLGIKEDITEKKFAEEKLRESEEFNRAVVEHSPLGISIRSNTGQLLGYNESWKKIWAKTKRVIEEDKNTKRKKVIFKLAGDYLGKWQKDVKKVYEEGGTLFIPEIETNIRKKSAAKWISQYFYAIKREDGKVVRVVVLTEDVTERKLAKEKLKESEERFRSVFENNPTGIYRTSPDGRVLMANPALVKMLGYKSFEELSSIDLEEYEFDKEFPRGKFKELIEKDGEIKNFESAWKKADGSRVHVKENAKVVRDEDGTIQYYEGTVEDITERKRAEKEIKNSREQLMNLSAHLQTIREEERASIAREIHDDLGQSLTALKMDIAWLDKNLYQNRDESYRKLQAMKRLTDTTINSVQKISSELRPGILDDLGLSSAIQWQAEEFSQRSGIRCRVKIKPKEIILDEKLSIAVYRIFQESLTNAARHSKATKIDTSLKLINNNLELYIKDNGIGVDEAMIKNPKSLGLIGMRERVYPWRGIVEISGEKGKGTTIKVNIYLKNKK